MHPILRHGQKILFVGERHRDINSGELDDNERVLLVNERIVHIQKIRLLGGVHEA